MIVGELVAAVVVCRPSTDEQPYRSRQAQHDRNRDQRRPLLHGAEHDHAAGADQTRSCSDAHESVERARLLCVGRYRSGISAMPSAPLGGTTHERAARTPRAGSARGRRTRARQHAAPCQNDRGLRAASSSGRYCRRASVVLAMIVTTRPATMTKPVAYTHTSGGGRGATRSRRR